MSAANPDIWNGNVLMAYDVKLSGSVFSASFLNTDYASFIAWRDWGWPDTTVYNCFGSAVIRSRDGALVYGCMHTNTLNAGLCYPPGGSLDQTDLRDDGSIDLDGSITRELAEETGLDAAGATAGGRWAIFDEQRISIARMLTFDSSADEIADQINAHILAEESPELSGSVILRAINDIDQPMVGFAHHLARYVLAD
ncbi:MAG: NUDIX hydrolase [Rhizobiales bacterium]|nr:NUDIX hydrolase [Hyphomicrobiales bacterium]